MSRPPARLVPIALVALTVPLLAACGGGTHEIATPTVDVPETVAIGVMPAPLTDSPTLPPPPSPPSTTAPDSGSAATEPLGPLEGALRDHVDGDRLLFIGDGALASVTADVDRQLCDALSVFGWEAELDAFPGNDDLSYVSAVLDLRFNPENDLDWDAIVLWVGNEIPADGLGIAELTETLDATIERVAPRPVVLYTLSELDSGRVQFNEIIRSRAEEHAHVAIIDWAELGGPAGEVLELDGVSLSGDGRKRLPLITAQALGNAEPDGDGGCLGPGVAVEEE